MPPRKPIAYISKVQEEYIPIYLTQNCPNYTPGVVNPKVQKEHIRKFFLGTKTNIDEGTVHILG